MSTVSTAPPPERADVEAWLEGVRGELQRVALALEPLLAEQNKLRAREALLLKLLLSFDETAVGEHGQPAEPGASQVSASITPVSAPEGSVFDYVRTCVLDILGEHGGGPMHINDIHSRFLAKGYRVPGAGRPANLTAHLGRCTEIVSPSRGFYVIGNSDGTSRHRKRTRKRR